MKKRSLLRRSTLSIFVLGVFVSPVNAQVAGGPFVGYSYVRAPVSLPVFLPDTGRILQNGSANLNGWNISFAGKLLPFVELTADVSGHYGTQNVTDECGLILGCHPAGDTLDANMYNFLLGPQVSVSRGRLTPFAHALFGLGYIREHTTARSFSDSITGFAYAMGGGLDYHLVGPLSWRLQGDFL